MRRPGRWESVEPVDQARRVVHGKGSFLKTERVLFCRVVTAGHKQGRQADESGAPAPLGPVLAQRQHSLTGPRIQRRVQPVL